MNTCDLFLCYRRRGAQTAKLFKRYLKRKAFPARVWYSDDEAVGNYRNDIPDLIGSALSVVLFVTDDFTDGFLDNGEFECITALEMTEIAKRLQDDSDLNIATIFLDRRIGFTPYESETIERLFDSNGIADPKETTKLFTQNNSIAFNAARDYEDELFAKLIERIMPSRFYRENVVAKKGHFGAVEIGAEYVVWGGAKGIAPENVFFESAASAPTLYRRIDRERIALDYEMQNNTMISVVDTDVVMEDDTENIVLTVHYYPIRYELFYKVVNLPRGQRDRLRIDAAIASYNPSSSSRYLVPNAMGLAFMVVTADHKLVFTRRSMRRGVRAGEYDCSIVEGLLPSAVDEAGNEYDIMDDCYLENEIRRSFREEMCKDDSLEDIFVSGVVLDYRYGQWNFVGSIESSLTAAEIDMIHNTREDTYEDNQLIFVAFQNELGELDLTDVQRNLKRFMREGFWDMGMKVTWSALSHLGFTDMELLEMSKNL